MSNPNRIFSVNDSSLWAFQSLGLIIVSEWFSMGRNKTFNSLIVIILGLQRFLTYLTVVESEIGIAI